MLEIRDLSKTYGNGVQALKNVSLDIPNGMFGLLGPNGAGKSTTINILAGLVRKSAGTARIWRHDIDREPRHASAAIGIVPQELNMDPFFTPRELLELQAGLYGVPKAERRSDEILAGAEVCRALRLHRPPCLCPHFLKRSSKAWRASL